jgi:septal ring factor EnvC (AmiA/AmiB activator)
VVLMPGDNQVQMKAARALKLTSESLKREAETLRLQREELARLKTKLEAKQAQLEAQKQVMKKEQATLALQLTKRQALRGAISQAQAKENETIEKLARQAENLQQLVGSLKKRKSEAAREIESDERPVSGKKGNLRSFAKAKGAIRTPVSGKLVQRFGVEKDKNETSKGMTIDARARAFVVAPFDGEVVFSGPFLTYGRLVILRHSDGFHTLLAGLDKVEVRNGEFLLEGEPIGAMGDGDAETKLYVELRKDNQPVDPAPWIKGL